MARILVVDDEKSIRIILREHLSSDGHEVTLAEDAQQAQEMMGQAEYDVAVIDIVMPRMGGIELLEYIHETAPRLQVIMMTGEPSLETAAKVVRLGAFDYLNKPIQRDTLERVVAKAVEMKHLLDTNAVLEDQNRKYHEGLEKLVEEQTAELKGAYQQLQASEQQLKASNQQLTASNQQLRASEQQLRASNQQLIESEENFSGFFNQARIGLALTTLEKGWFKINPKLLETLGYQERELKEKTWAEITHPDDLDADVNLFTRLLAGEIDTYELEKRFIRKDGRISFAVITISKLHNKDGSIRYIVASVQDVTEKKRIEDALRRSEEKFRALYENAPYGIVICEMIRDREQKIVDFIHLQANAATPVQTGFDLSMLVGKRASAIVDKKSLDRLLTLYVPVVNADTTIHYKEHFDVYDRTLDVRAFPLKDDLFILSFMDITGHIETGQALRESNERHQDLLNAINSGVAVYKVINDGQSGSDYIIQDFNRVSLELEGMTKEEVVGKNLFDLRPTIDEYGLIPVFRKVWKTGEPAFFPAKVYVDEKYANYYENRVFRLLSGEIVAVYDDVTERKRMEAEKHSMQAQLQQAQKLESIGTLASGVAHEINNPVMGVINYADLIHEHEKDETLKEYAQNIMDEGTRIARIVKSLLSFSRQDSDEHSTARIADIINGSLSLTSAALRKDQITLKVEIPDDLPRITCHTQQIQQVILNLITNAQFTLNERYTGYDENKLLAITVSEFEDEGRKWQRVTVEDHGTGIPEDFLERIFDPFFTTKCRSEGTGLGLSVSYGIMKEHGGKLSVECESGKYTRFHIDLPVGLEERKGSGSA